jgi:hypothetical protein
MSNDEEAGCFSDAERQDLSSVLDQLIPQSRDGRLPAAGEAGLTSHIEQVVADTPEIGPLIRAGLEAVASLTRARKAERFRDLNSSARSDILEELANSQPGLLPLLTFQAFVGYYQIPQVVEALGLEARPPYPKGYEMGPDDPTLLDPVRARPGPLREV